ncbi:MAG: DUF4434 domain-containing protein, partial [Acidobacteriaceae bacterium]
MKLVRNIAGRFSSAPLIIFSFLALSPALLPAQEIHVSVSTPRARRGQSVTFSFQVSPAEATRAGELDAEILAPSVGVTPLPIHARGGGKYQAVFTVPADAPQGLYAVQAWKSDENSSTDEVKATFLVGKITADFFEPAHLTTADPVSDLDGYLKDFRGLGGNLIIAHGIVTTDRAYFHCAICKVSPAADSSQDIVEMLLRGADARGIGVLLSVGWDMTRQSPYQNRWTETQSIMRELYRLYGSHPSFLGFYVYQEGSGLYYVPYVRKFTRFAKGLNPGLLTACAPYVDNPLLAGYLGDLPDLDIILYQAMVMASYRPDNRQHYPLRRAKDFCSLSTGAKKLQNKIALTHVELFGYRENDIGSGFASYRNQYGQFLSVGTVADNDGIAMFAYQPLIYSRLKSHPQALTSQKAVRDGMRAFRLLSAASSKPALLAAYFPYSDWVADRWAQSYLPAFDAFRILGIPLDVLPYEPPTDESLLPYYPFHLNRDVLARLLRRKTVLVLPNVSGFQQTDSELIEKFVQEGGAVIAFGPQIPTGVTYRRTDVFGVERLSPARHDAIAIRNALGKRALAGRRRAFAPSTVPSWRSSGAKVIATFEDGSAAITVNRYGKGVAIVVATDAMTAARFFPDLIRDVVDAALSSEGKTRAVDVLGADENFDDAISEIANGFQVAVVNHNRTAVAVTLQPLNRFSGEWADWFDLEGNR